MNQLTLTPTQLLPTLVVAAGQQTSLRFLEFFASNIRNVHTRRAYSRAVGEFLAWCADVGVMAIDAVQPLHVATWIEGEAKKVSAPSVKQRLAAVRDCAKIFPNVVAVEIDGLRVRGLGGGIS